MCAVRGETAFPPGCHGAHTAGSGGSSSSSNILLQTLNKVGTEQTSYSHNLIGERFVRTFIKNMELLNDHLGVKAISAFTSVRTNETIQS